MAFVTKSFAVELSKEQSSRIASGWGDDGLDGFSNNLLEQLTKNWSGQGNPTV